MVIAHNMTSSNIIKNLKISENKHAKSTEKLSSGYRINRAADDAAGLTISEKMRIQIRGLSQGERNIQDGVSLCNVADGALQEVDNILGRIKELSVQAANDTNTSSDRLAINEEIDHLKKEINRISVQTEFNTFNIFCTPFEIQTSSNINIVQIFNANDTGYPLDPDDPDSFGGIVIQNTTGNDERISWKRIDSNMVEKNPDTGETVFKAGIYKYNAGSYTLTIECKDGTKPPQIKASYQITADYDGIHIANNTIPWNKVKDENNNIINSSHVHEGYYHFDIGDGQGGFWTPEFDSLDHIIEGINTATQIYNRKYVSETNGYYSEQAMDITDTGSKMKINNSVLNALKNNDNLDLRLKADKDGVWLCKINPDNTDGAILTDSKVSWSTMGINKWNEGTDISDSINYTYNYIKDDYNINFDFSMLDVTNLDELIQGINNANVLDGAQIVNDKLSLDFTPGNGVKNGSLTNHTISLNLYEEADLGRNFDIAVGDITQSNLVYDSVNNSFSLKYTGASGNDVLTSSSTKITSKNDIIKNMEAYEDYLTQRQIHKLIKNTSTPTLANIDDVIGSSNIEQSTNLSLSGLSFTATEPLSGNYAGIASMDFSGLGTSYDLYDLLGTGFNSTCSTCSNHYSVQFVYDEDKNSKYNVNIKGNDWNLKINVNSDYLQNNVSNGADFTKALINIFKESGYNKHYQQYASVGSKLYVLDNRHSALGSFDPVAYNTSDANIDISMKGKNSSMNLSYSYDIVNDLNPFATLSKDDKGLLVSDDNGATFEVYDPTKSYTNPQRYRIKIDPASHGKDWETLYDNIMQNIANQSNIKLSSTDYDYLSYYADENPSKALVCTFDQYIEDNKHFWIQGGFSQGDGLNMDWENFNTYSLGLGDANTLTRESSEKLIGSIELALNKINSIRTTFGAYSNRLEHFYSNDQNIAENTQSAESKIRDTDMANEMVENSKHNILIQAAQSVLSQANSSKHGVLILLQ